MSREFIFRAWLNDSEILLDSVTVYDNMIGCSYDDLKSETDEKGLYLNDETIDNNGVSLTKILSGDDWFYISFEELELMQFTGKIDINKKKIYESDVLKTPMGNIVVIFFGEKIYRFGNDTIQIFGWLCRSVKSGHIETLDDSMIGEIIGNIYQHPNLLNSEPTVKESDTTVAK